MTKIADAFVSSWDYLTGSYDEDGAAIVKTRFQVIAEKEDGQRFIHFKAFDDGEKAERLAERVSKAASIKADAYWSETDPAYGSEAYQGLDDTGFFYEREKREDEERRANGPSLLERYNAGF